MFIGFTAVWIRFLKYSNVFITDKKLKNTVKSRDFNTYRRIDKCLQDVTGKLPNSKIALCVDIYEKVEI